MSRGLTPLRLDSACCRELNWRTDLPPKLRPAPVEACLGERGWTSRSCHPVLRVLRHPEGHEMAWVVDSGRVQIRVHVTVPQGQRRGRAAGLYDELGGCLETAHSLQEARPEDPE